MADVELCEYQETWPAQFLQVAAEIRAATASPTARIEHIGSTSVPGLCAKPVLDILLGVQAFDDVEADLPALVAAGFAYRPEYEQQIPDRRYFVRPAAAARLRVHLHVVLQGGRLWHQHLHFRDCLRADAGLRCTYAGLKRDLAVVHAADKAAYTEAKAPFIQQVLASCPCPIKTPGMNA